MALYSRRVIRSFRRIGTFSLAAIFSTFISLIPSNLCAHPPSFQETTQIAKSIETLLSALVASDTTNPPGNEARAIEIGARRLKEAGIPYEITEFSPGRRNLVARLTSSEEKPPILLLAHVDVVSSDNQPWTTNPHQLVEADHYLYGRGVADDLGFAATALEMVVALKESKIPLKRDVILAWTGDEESGGQGIQYLLKNHSKSIQAAFALNEGGVIELGSDGQPKFAAVQVAEKIYCDFEFIAKGPTGHSSRPVPGNPIYRLSKALDRLSRFQFPARLLPVTRAYFAKRAQVETPEIAKAMLELSHSKNQSKLPKSALKALETDPMISPLLRTTCVATKLNAGTNPNSLPAEAKANVNCRILPDETIESVQEQLTRIIQDPKVQVRIQKELAYSSPSPLEGEGPLAIEKAVHAMWPGLPIIPTMSTGATDSRYLRAAGIPAYGISPIALSKEEIRRYHAADERIPKTSIERGVEFYRQLLSLALAQ